MDRNNYLKLVDKLSPPSKKGKDFVMAFVIGGLICTIGQILRECFLYIGFNEKLCGMYVSSILILLAAILTGFGLFEKIAKHAGAGTLVPITGFANSVVAPAIEFKSEGFILGVGANMFKIAGPVILYGTFASVIYGVIYWITTLF